MLTFTFFYIYRKIIALVETPPRSQMSSHRNRYPYSHLQAIKKVCPHSHIMVTRMKRVHKVTIVNGEIYRYEDWEGVGKHGISTLKTTSADTDVEGRSQSLLTYVDEMQQLNIILICLSFFLTLGIVSLAIQLRQLRSRALAAKSLPVYQKVAER